MCEQLWLRHLGWNISTVMFHRHILFNSLNSTGVVWAFHHLENDTQDCESLYCLFRSFCLSIIKMSSVLTLQKVTFCLPSRNVPFLPSKRIIFSGYASTLCVCYLILYFDSCLSFVIGEPLPACSFLPFLAGGAGRVRHFPELFKFKGFLGNKFLTSYPI